MKKNKKIKIILIVLFIAILSWYSFLFEPNNFKIEELNIRIKNLPASFEGLKIVQLSDFHTKKFGKKERRVLQIVEQLNPDYVFITGDSVDKSTKDIKACQEFWRELGREYQGKIFGVLGNHEHWNRNFYLLAKTLEDSGIPILNNENEKLARGNDYLYLIGVDDPRTGYDNLDIAMRGIKENNISKILLAHSPEIIESIKGKGIDLILAGHTHGGQVKIPFIRPFWIPTRDHGKYASGLFAIDSTYLYVNRGIGSPRFIRFNASPEITLINLVK